MIIEGVSSRIEQFKELIKLHNHYEEKKSSRQRALAFASASWHLIEWVLKETNPNPSKAQLGKCFIQLVHI